MFRHKVFNIGFWCAAVLFLTLLTACSGDGGRKVKVRDLPDIVEADTLRVLTMYGPVSYFIYKDDEMGYEYEMSKLLADDIGVELKLIIASDEDAMIDMLQGGKADLIAYKLPYTADNKERVCYTAKEYITNQVLVQCKSDTMVRDVLDIVGRDVYVRKGSIYDMRMQNLNNEVGGGINIVYAPDTLSSEDLVAAVAMYKIPLTIASKDVAMLSRTYFGNLDYSVNVSFPQRAAWVVNNSSPKLMEYIDTWYADAAKQKRFKKIYQKYFERSKYFEASGIPSTPSTKRYICRYDDLLRTYAAKLGWDWRLLAALVYKESKFNPRTVSWAGACGLMQLMPKTARSLGIEKEEDMFDPEKSIAAGVKYLKKLERIFSSIQDRDERIKFTLAAYNSGPGHILDGRAFARKYGKNPDVWEGNVEPYIMLKSEPEFYTDTICKSGYCRGEETVKYVDDVLAKWEQYKQRGIPK